MDILFNLFLLLVVILGTAKYGITVTIGAVVFFLAVGFLVLVGDITFETVLGIRAIARTIKRWFSKEKV